MTPGLGETPGTGETPGHSDRPPARTTRFGWQETPDVLEEVGTTHELSVDERGTSFVALDARGDCQVQVTPPMVQPILGRDPESYLEQLPEYPETAVLLLVQAGAAAIGIAEEGELTQHKAIKKYVVRGRGKAQATHLKARGKSRYGSRLRLQNHQRLLSEINERIGTWAEELPAVGQRFYSCPVRTWPELFETRPAPPWPRDEWTKIPLDVAVPDFAELRRVWWELSHGSLRLW